MMSPKITYNSCNCNKINENELPILKLSEHKKTSKVISFYKKPHKTNNKMSLF